MLGIYLVGNVLCVCVPLHLRVFAIPLTNINLFTVEQLMVEVKQSDPKISTKLKIRQSKQYLTYN